MFSMRNLSISPVAWTAMVAAIGAGWRVLAVAAVAPGCSGGELGNGASGRTAFADVLVPTKGVPDRGADSAVVGLVAGGTVICSGVLLAEDLVLSARHCADPTGCTAFDGGASSAFGQGPPSPLALSILVGDDDASGVVRANVRSVELPDGADPCTADLAVLWLDAPVRDVQPLRIRTSGAAAGAHTRAVGFGPEAGGVAKRVYDHVRVMAAAATRLAIELGPCALGCGGPLLDEASAEVTGVVLGPHVAPDAGASFDIAARVDPWLAWLESAIARGDRVPSAGTVRVTTRKGPIDVGAACLGATDCAAGVCVRQSARQYCSRRCDSHDRCPLRSRCAASVEGAAVCVLD